MVTQWPRGPVDRNTVLRSKKTLGPPRTALLNTQSQTQTQAHAPATHTRQEQTSFKETKQSSSRSQSFMNSQWAAVEVLAPRSTSATAQQRPMGQPVPLVHVGVSVRSWTPTPA